MAGVRIHTEHARAVAREQSREQARTAPEVENAVRDSLAAEILLRETLLHELVRTGPRAAPVVGELLVGPPFVQVPAPQVEQDMLADALVDVPAVGPVEDVFARTKVGGVFAGVGDREAQAADEIE
jgi:hypothetical protein